MRATRLGASTIRLYFFWSQGCPHCRQALPFIDELSARYAWLDVDSRELGTRENALSYLALARKLGREAEYSLLFPA
jgi:thiol-disulfide isomerase/thioredoxin